MRILIILTKTNSINKLKHTIIIEKKKVICTGISFHRILYIKICDKKYIIDYTERIKIDIIYKL
jgi:hypothetical protein